MPVKVFFQFNTVICFYNIALVLLLYQPFNHVPIIIFHEYIYIFNRIKTKERIMFYTLQSDQYNAADAELTSK